MKRAMAIVPLAALLLVPAGADEPGGKKRSAAERLAAGADQARDQGKAVFLLFGAPS